MMQEIKEIVAKAATDLFDLETEPEVTRTEEQFGDYSTNIALQLAGHLKKTPQEIAKALAQRLSEVALFERVEVAGPGFINIRLKDEVLAAAANKATEVPKPLKGQTVVAEYSDPNPFKVLHAGHLYTSVVGDAIASLYEAAGANVHRVNFGGDVGLHVARAMWAIIKRLGGEDPQRLNEVPQEKRAQWLAEAYVEGTRAHEDDENAKSQITELNKRIYQLHAQDDKNSPLARIYWTCRDWSYKYFAEFYKKIGTSFEKYYPESQTVELGLKAVKDNLGKVFEESEGAIVFKGEVHNMHTRVFINSQGLPTYETKDVGLILKKWEDYHFDKSLVITGNEIYEYMQVVLKAVEQIAPDLARKTIHLTHGIVKLAGGGRMSSRKGNILRAEEVLAVARQANQGVSGKDQPEVVLAAVKYAFLKQALGQDIIYDPEESVAVTGNSGPYLQYAHARARSILQKGEKTGNGAPLTSDLDNAERSLAGKISEYPEVVTRATQELSPHYICTYLYELAQSFNRFYESNRVLGDPREPTRLALVNAYARVLKNGLGLLNIAAPERI